MGFQHLPHIHPRGNPQGIQDNIHRGAVGKIGHVLSGKNPGNYPLVSMPSGHLIPYGQLSFDGQVDFDHFDHPGREFIPLFHFGDFPLKGPFDQSHLFLVVPDDPFQLFFEVLPFGDGQVFPFFDRQFGQFFQERFFPPGR